MIAPDWKPWIEAKTGEDGAGIAVAARLGVEKETAVAVGVRIGAGAAARAAVVAAGAEGKVVLLDTPETMTVVGEIATGAAVAGADCRMLTNLGIAGVEDAGVEMTVVVGVEVTGGRGGVVFETGAVVRTVVGWNEAGMPVSKFDQDRQDRFATLIASARADVAEMANAKATTATVLGLMRTSLFDGNDPPSWRALINAIISPASSPVPKAGR